MGQISLPLVFVLKVLVEGLCPLVVRGVLKCVQKLGRLCLSLVGLTRPNAANSTASSGTATHTVSMSSVLSPGRWVPTGEDQVSVEPRPYKKEEKLSKKRSSKFKRTKINENLSEEKSERKRLLDDDNEDEEEDIFSRTYTLERKSKHSKNKFTKNTNRISSKSIMKSDKPRQSKMVRHSEMDPASNEDLQRRLEYKRRLYLKKYNPKLYLQRKSVEGENAWEAYDYPSENRLDPSIGFTEETTKFSKSFGRKQSRQDEQSFSDDSNSDLVQKKKVSYRISYSDPGPIRMQKRQLNPSGQSNLLFKKSSRDLDPNRPLFQRKYSNRKLYIESMLSRKLSDVNSDTNDDNGEDDDAEESAMPVLHATGPDFYKNSSRKFLENKYNFRNDLEGKNIYWKKGLNSEGNFILDINQTVCTSNYNNDSIEKPHLLFNDVTSKKLNNFCGFKKNQMESTSSEKISRSSERTPTSASTESSLPNEDTSVKILLESD